MSITNRHWTGEDVAAGFADVAYVIIAWMKSPHHRANILNPIFTHLGVGFATLDQDSIYAGFVWTQDFGSGGIC